MGLYILVLRPIRNPTPPRRKNLLIEGLRIIRKTTRTSQLNHGPHYPFSERAEILEHKMFEIMFESLSPNVCQFLETDLF